jgi:Ca2+/Na+ antiporter
MNICWVAGASAIANDLVLGRKQILFMFPAMFVIMGAMLMLLRRGYTLTKRDSLILLGLYVAYLVSFLVVFPPTV